MKLHEEGAGSCPILDGQKRNLSTSHSECNRLISAVLHASLTCCGKSCGNVVYEGLIDMVFIEVT